VLLERRHGVLVRTVVVLLRKSADWGLETMAMGEFSESVGELLPLLRCPVCHADRRLDLRGGAAPVDTSLPLTDRHLLCLDCQTQYPVTDDCIPILWDAELRSIYNQMSPNPPERSSAIAANLSIYDHISDDYHLYSRRNPQIAQRIRSAVRKILDHSPGGVNARTARSDAAPRYHLDFGCGPGHVIGWLKEFGFRQIGMDISLQNLRNARQHTGCLVVCANASNMPLADDSIDIITESSVLHHIFDWKSAIRESIRVCKKEGGIIIDSEPSKDQMAWSRLAVMAFNARFPVYKALSYVLRDKYLFRDMKKAKLNLQAEIHFQPGRGFSLDEIEQLFAVGGFRADIISSPAPDLASNAPPGWKSIVLSLLSARNPWNPKYGPFTAVASGSATRGA
jgi:SAM-dependent methyltransferase/uncharacterized protein YbaR (Trm112 family)